MNYDYDLIEELTSIANFFNDEKLLELLKRLQYRIAGTTSTYHKSSEDLIVVDDIKFEFKNIISEIIDGYFDKKFK